MKNYHIKFDSEDVALASFARSGNTWVKSILIWLIIKYEKLDRKFDVESIRNTIPFDKHIFNGTNNGGADNLEVFPKIIKTHNQYLKKYKRSIYLIRDPRDVAVSCFYLYKYKKGFKIYNFSDFVRYIFTQWCENVASWKNEAGLIVTYEDMHKDPFGEIKKITHYLGVEVGDKDMKRAIEAATFEKLHQMEKDSYEKHGKNHTDQRRFFARNGKMNEWKKYNMDDELVFLRSKIEKYELGEFLRKIGYSDL